MLAIKIIATIFVLLGLSTNINALNNLGLNANDISYGNLLEPEEKEIEWIDFKSFHDDHWKNKEEHNVVLDVRSFKASLSRVPQSYNVPSTVFDLHSSVFPASRNYLLYGSKEEVTSVSAKLFKMGVQKVLAVATSDFTSDWTDKGYETENKEYPYYEIISLEEMYDRYITGEPENLDPILVDVRSPEAYQKLHIKYAINIPLERLSKKLDNLPVTQKVYLYGADHSQGIKAAEIFANEYRSYTMPIKGGFSAWIDQRFPVEIGN